MCPSLISFMLLDYIVLKGKVRVSLWVCLKVIPVVLNTVTLKVRNGWRKDKKKKKQMDHNLPTFFLSPSVQLIILYIRRLKFGDSNLIVQGALGSYGQFPS